MNHLVHDLIVLGPPAIVAFLVYLVFPPRSCWCRWIGHLWREPVSTPLGVANAYETCERCGEGRHLYIDRRLPPSNG